MSSDQVRAKFEAFFGKYDRAYEAPCWEAWQAATASHAAEVEALRHALRRIAYAQPDRLDHSRDVAIIERAARIAAAALKGD
jgi:2-oxo-4-hydroxy-4-carboxy--5-ureidoimidazoline (OHCU) decarboxylase